MKFQLKPISAALTVACIAMAYGQAARADVTVKIGSAAPLTGNIAHMGEDAADGVKLAVQQINKAGNLVIGGQKVVLEVDSLDDQADPRTGTNVAQKLVDDGVVAVIGHLNSGVSIPASKKSIATTASPRSPRAPPTRSTRCKAIRPPFA